MEMTRICLLRIVGGGLNDELKSLVTTYVKQIVEYDEIMEKGDIHSWPIKCILDIAKNISSTDEILGQLFLNVCTLTRNAIEKRSSNNNCVYASLDTHSLPCLVIYMYANNIPHNDFVKNTLAVSRFCLITRIFNDLVFVPERTDPVYYKEIDSQILSLHNYLVFQLEKDKNMFTEHLLSLLIRFMCWQGGFKDVNGAARYKNRVKRIHSVPVINCCDIMDKKHYDTDTLQAVEEVNEMLKNLTK